MLNEIETLTARIAELEISRLWYEAALENIAGDYQDDDPKRKVAEFQDIANRALDTGKISTPPAYSLERLMDVVLAEWRLDVGILISYIDAQDRLIGKLKKALTESAHDHCAMYCPTIAKQLDTGETHTEQCKRNYKLLELEPDSFKTKTVQDGDEPIQ